MKLLQSMMPTQQLNSLSINYKIHFLNYIISAFGIIRINIVTLRSDMSLKDSIQTEKLPSHIAIIMDGNGRWAKKHSKERTFGHQNGVTAVREVTEACAELGVKYLTLYAFSTENWARPTEEVGALMELLVYTIKQETETLLKNDVKLNAIGDLESLPEKCHDELMEAIEATKHNKRTTLTLALSYSSRWEITQATKQIAQEVANGNMNPNNISEETISDHLATKGMPDPELLIRTSGECRISNYLLWQIAYAELYFTEILWPDFTRENLYDALVSYQNRERRFGKVSEQLS